MPRLSAKLTVAAAAAAAAVAGVAEATPTWNVTIPEFASIAMSVASQGPKTLLAFTADNGKGTAVLRTTDGGAQWSALPAAQAGAYLGGAATADSAAAASFFALYGAQAPGFNFTASKGVLGVQSQSVEAIGTKGFGATGSNLVTKGNGVAVSADGGANYKFVNISALETSARYGAFPSEKVWYVSAGTWPENSAQRDGVAVTRRVTLRQDARGNPGMRLERELTAPKGGNGTSADGWQAQIVKTTDGGATWSSVYKKWGEFYFNQINCGSEDHCVAVAESDGTGGSTAPGVHVFTTSDGGQTWKETFSTTDPHDSLMAVRFASATDVWVGGGHMVQGDFTGLYLYSSDSGATWQSVTVPNTYPVDFTFASATEGYAVALNAQSITSFLTLEA